MKKRVRFEAARESGDALEDNCAIKAARTKRVKFSGDLEAGDDEQEEGSGSEVHTDQTHTQPRACKHMQCLSLFLSLFLSLKLPLPPLPIS